MSAGDILVFHKDYQRLGIKKGEQVEVVSTDPSWQMLRVRRSDGSELALDPQRLPGFQVYEAREIGLAPGDQIRWMRNDRELGLRNGQDLRVDAFEDSKILLTARDGRQIELLKSNRLHLDHNYVSTVYASQGKTSERVIISADKTFGREAMYVAVTRAKASVTLYTQDKERMCQMAEISRAKVSAKELVRDTPQAQDIEKNKIDDSQRQGMRRGLSR